jgi:glycosyltransferase involved in cell wall biosynthesis
MTTRRLPSISVIIPAFNEARYLPETLDRLRTAERCLSATCNAEVEIVVVDNASTDRTADTARAAGVTLVHEAERNIAAVRNAGASIAAHDVLVFVDADTLVPPNLLSRIAETMSNPACAGGAADAVYRPEKPVITAYLKVWRLVGLAGGMAQGACQFCRKDVFRELGGYDETQYIGEDVDFHWRLRRWTARRGLATAFLRDVTVTASSRRFNAWPWWRTFILTNPVLVFALRRRQRPWGGWYGDPPR